MDNRCPYDNSRTCCNTIRPELVVFMKRIEAELREVEESEPKREIASFDTDTYEGAILMNMILANELKNPVQQYINIAAAAFCLNFLSLK